MTSFLSKKWQYLIRTIIGETGYRRSLHYSQCVYRSRCVFPKLSSLEHPNDAPETVTVAGHDIHSMIHRCRIKIQNGLSQNIILLGRKNSRNVYQISNTAQASLIWIFYFEFQRIQRHFLSENEIPCPTLKDIKKASVNEIRQPNESISLLHLPLHKIPTNVKEIGQTSEQLFIGEVKGYIILLYHEPRTMRKSRSHSKPDCGFHIFLTCLNNRQTSRCIIIRG